jgi:hypothetical protein
MATTVLLNRPDRLLNQLPVFRALSFGALRKHAGEQYADDSACSALFRGTQVEQAAQRTSLRAGVEPSERNPDSDWELTFSVPVNARSTCRAACR